MPKARRKKATSKQERRRPKGPTTGKQFFAFIASPVVRRLILTAVIVAALYYSYSRLYLVPWAISIWESIFTTLGFGLIIIAVALVVLIWIVWQGRFSASARRWNWFAGGILLTLAVWGGLSLVSPESGILRRATLGGYSGQSIIESITGSTGAVDATGSLRLAGFVLLGIIFIAPHKSWQAISAPFRGIQQLLRKISRPRPKPIRPPYPTPIKGREEVITPTPPEVSPPAIAAKPLPLPGFASPIAAARSSEHSERAAAWQSKYEPLLTPSGWQLPPIDILDKPSEVELNKDDIDKRARLIEEALSSYGVEARVVQINTGPTVTQFGIEPGWDRKYKEIKEKGQTRLEEVSKTRIRVDRITALSNDLALALAAPSLRIEAPVPGKPMVGIEVPNTTFGSVSLRSVIESTPFQKISARSKLAIALGKGAGGEAVAADLTKMPHLLIAGATGSGKTVCLDAIICCLLAHNSPDDVRFIMVDPKRVELVAFNGMPHLAAPVVVDSNKAIKALRWLSGEMDKRYQQFAQAGVRNIEGYNKDRSPGEGMPYLVLVIDELADLMMTSFDEVEHGLCRLAQLARATGIHLIVATQRPSVDVVTGLIKANFPSRISFVVTSQIDSRTILDTVGAEKLLGRGDMLFMPSEAGRPKRLQGCFIADAEIERLVYFWGNQQDVKVSYVDFDEAAVSVGSSQRPAPPPDPLLEEAKRLAQEHKHISTSFLQRRLHVGYPRAARLMDTLEQEGLAEESPPEEAI